MPEGPGAGWTLAALIGEGALRESFLALGRSALAGWLRQAEAAYILVNAGHILAIGLLIGSIVLLDLKLLGGFRRLPSAVLAPPLARMALVGTVLALCSGVSLFAVRPDAYLANAAFSLKMLLILLALANALALRASRGWRRVLAGEAPGPPVRAAALASLVLWPGTLLAGRWIGFL